MSPSDFVSRGQALVTAGQYQEAVKVCRLGLLGRPTAVDGRLVLGQALLALRRYDEVLAEMRVALELEARNAAAHMLKGEALLRKGDAYAASDALARARQLAPGDPGIAALIAETDVAIAAGGGRRGGVGFGDFGDSMTKHYPSHRGSERSGEPGSTSFTRPSVPAVVGGTGTAKVATARKLPAGGDKSGTVEIDPDLEGVELDDDDVAEPPPPRATTEDVGDADVVEVEARDLLRDGGRAALRGPSFAAEDLDEATVAERPPSAPRGLGPLDETPQPEPLPARAASPARAGSAGAGGRGEGGRRDPGRDAGRDLGRDLGRDAGRDAGSTGRAPRSEAAGLRAEPARDTGAGVAARSASPRGAAALDPVLARSAAAIDALFPDEESKPGPGARAAAAPAPRAAEPAARAAGPAARAAGPAARAAGPAARAAPRPAARADDMDTIRAGLGMSPRAAETPAPAAADGAARADSTGVVVAPGGARPERKGSGTEIVRPGDTPRPGAPVRAAAAGPALRSRAATLAWIAIAVVVLGGGVWAGFMIRGVRLERALTAARGDAAAAARADTWVGWQKARDLWAGVAEAQDRGDNRAAVLRARAVLAADFGDDVPGARFAAQGKGDAAEPDALIARALLADLDGDAAAAQTAAAAAQAAASGAVGDYLVGRAALVGQRWTDAAQAFAESLKAEARPATYLGLAQAEAGRGRFAEATAACDKALALVPDHPGALIERARIAAAAGAPPAVIAGAIAGLDKLAAEAQRPAAQQTRGVAPLETALAALARAELEHARGDDAAARRALEIAAASAADDLRVSDGVIALHLALGDEARAAELAQRAAQTWPKSPGPRVALAAAALAAGDAARALDALGKAGDVGDRPFALALRGRAHLAAGDLDAAARDLDAALARLPDDEPALLARAEVDLARGDARAAAARLAARAGATAASPDLLVAYAAALRGSGQRELARPLLDRLTTNAGASAGPAAGRAWLERARLARADGDLALARADYARAVEALPRGAPGLVDARVEAAALQIDSGDVAAARDALDRLVAEVAGDGRVLIAAARAHVLTGDSGGAKALLDRAEATASAPRWELARERGRLALRLHQGAAAVDALERAASLAPDDGETRLLLIDANLLGKDDASARRGLGDVLARFKGRPEAALAAGRVAYYFSKDAEARGDFQQAHDALVKAKAPARAVADATYWLGRVRYDDNPDEARKLLVEATTLDPTLADAYVFLGLIDTDKADPKSAVAWFQKAAALDPDNVDTWFDLGQAAVAAKQNPVAKQAYTEYLHRAPSGDNAADARAALKKL